MGRNFPLQLLHHSFLSAVKNQNSEKTFLFSLFELHKQRMQASERESVEKGRKREENGKSATKTTKHKKKFFNARLFNSSTETHYKNGII